MDDTLYDGTGLAPTGEPAAREPGEQDPAAEPVDPAPQTDGDGTSYEDAASSGSAADTVTDGTPAVAVPPVEIPGELVESDTAGTGESVNAETGEVTAPGEPLPVIESDHGVPLPPADDAPADDEQPGQLTP